MLDDLSSPNSSKPASAETRGSNSQASAACPRLLWPVPPDFESAAWVQRFPPIGPPAAVDIHVYAVTLVASPKRLVDLAANLSETEAARAARFRFDTHRHRYLVAHGILRRLLAAYCHTDPRKLAFTTGLNGKPALAPPFTPAGLQFNLSHSEDLALIAITTGVNVGVDVEKIRALKDVDALVARFFSPGESAAFRALPEPDKPVAFFNLWTRKEAWLKATGQGIGEALALVEVSFLSGEPARLRALPAQLGWRDSWSLHALTPAVDYAAALAVERPDARVECWALDTDL